MKKMLILVLLIVCGGTYFKDNLTSGLDSHVQSMGMSLPTLGVGRFSELWGKVTAMLPWQQAGGASFGFSQAGQALAARPGPSNAPTASSAYTGSFGQNGGSFGQNGARGPDLGNIPAELVRFMTPSLLTTTPAGTQNLSPEARVALQLIMAQARANPVAFKEQLSAAAKASSGPR
jgi:hypothetical protein